MGILRCAADASCPVPRCCISIWIYSERAGVEGDPQGRVRAGLTQRELALGAGTSQATVSAYEAGAKAPSVATLSRLLGAAGARLTTAPAVARVRVPTSEENERVARDLLDVLALAEMLPSRPRGELRFPPLRS